MTLVEMLVATAATLMLMGAIAQVFSVFGSAVTNSRSMIEQDARLRSVAWRLRTDLSGVTARTLPPLEPSINFLTQFRDVARNLPPRAYDKPESRERVLDAMQRAIDLSIDEEEVALG
jgi:hypothetical protein